MELVTQGAFAVGDAPAPSGSYFLVILGVSSSFAPLAPGSSLRIGCGADCEIRLEDSTISPLHARVDAVSEGAKIQPLGGALVTVNGEPLTTGPRLLVSGDVVNVGTASLVFRGVSEADVVRVVETWAALRVRLHQEVSRAIRYQRPLTLAVITGAVGVDWADRVRDAVTSALRTADVVGWGEAGDLLVMLPETSQTASVPLDRLLAALDGFGAELRVGYATCPGDGVSIDVLLSIARSAAQKSIGGVVESASSLASTLTIGQKVVILAEPAMKRLFSLVERLAASDLPVLVTGETGVGKEVVASAIHGWSPRRTQRLVAINCAALPEALLEGELFGWEKGAFSGAIGSKAGLFESATGGTVFLDEVGELPAAAQAKLLRVLESKRVSRLGTVNDRALDVRIVAATNRSLEGEVKRGRFREDLYFRLSAATVVIPPLRDRTIELPILARTFLDHACEQLGRSRLEISAPAMLRLARHPWPGNVRELRNVMDYAAATATSSEVLPEHLGARLESPRSFDESSAPASVGPDSATESRLFEGVTGIRGAVTLTTFRNIYDEIRELEKRRMSEALLASGGVRVRAAELIGMPLRTFVTKLKEYQLGQDTARGKKSGSR